MYRHGAAWFRVPDVNAAVDAADAAFGTWSEKTTRDRGLILFRAADW